MTDQVREAGRRFRVNHPGWYSQRNREEKQKLFDFLGGKCVCCGFKDMRALQLDHRMGAAVPFGHKDRGSDGLRRSLLAGRYCVLLFQLLCANCNSIKRDERQEWGRYKYDRGLRPDNAPAFIGRQAKQRA